MHITGPEATIIGSGIASLGYVALMLKQKPAKTAALETRDIAIALKQDINQLHSALTSHTADDAANFRELRGQIVPKRRRGWLMPALAVIAHLFLK